MGRPQLRVLYLSRDYTTHDRRFIESFSARGWQVTHAALTSRRLEPRPVSEGVRQLAWLDAAEPRGVSAWAERIGEFKWLISRLRPDAVIAGPVQTGAFVAAMADAAPLVTVSWGSDVLVDTDRSALCTEITRFTLSKSTLVFGDCRAVREAVKRHSSLDDEHIVTFPWGIDLDRFSPGDPDAPVRPELGWENCEVFISTRTWEPIYAIDVLLDAFRRVVLTRPRARLLLLGDGSLAPEIRAAISRLRLESVIHAPGRIDQERLPSYFRSADAYVSSALSDGTSVSLLEAMGCGLPAVVTDSYGNLEWVQNGVNGALAAPGDSASLAAAMQAVIEDPSRRREMSAANVALARRSADWHRNVPALLDAVESLVNA